MDTAITQTASSVGKGIPCKRLWMQDVMCTMRVPSHLCFRRVGVRCLRRRIRRRLIHASGGRLPKRIYMFVSGTSWREDELVLMEFDLRGFNASWKYASYLCLGRTTSISRVTETIEGGFVNKSEFIENPATWARK